MKKNRQALDSPEWKSAMLDELKAYELNACEFANHDEIDRSQIGVQVETGSDRLTGEAQGSNRSSGLHTKVRCGQY